MKAEIKAGIKAEIKAEMKAEIKAETKAEMKAEIKAEIEKTGESGIDFLRSFRYNTPTKRKQFAFLERGFT